MSEKFEQNIREWYNKSLTGNLEYLDLAKNPTPRLSEIANNLGVVFDKVSLLSKVSLKHLYSLKEENQALREEVAQLRTSISSLENEVVNNKPLTKSEVRILVTEIAKQPKLVEEEVVKLVEELKTSVRKVEQLIKEVKGLLGE